MPPTGTGAGHLLGMQTSVLRHLRTSAEHSGNILTDPKVLIPHGVQANGGLGQVSLQLLKGNVNPEHYIITNSQLFTQTFQVIYTLFISLVTTATD